MKKKQNIRRQGKGYLFFGVLAMFLLVVSLLLTSFQIAIYGDSKYHFYEEEYRKYRVTESLGMELSDVMTVTDHMMDYLIGREEKLSIETDVDGKRQDFFNGKLSGRSCCGNRAATVRRAGNPANAPVFGP